jgi:membrane protein YdbS with pleckstrin-like domain
MAAKVNDGRDSEADSRWALAESRQNLRHLKAASEDADDWHSRVSYVASHLMSGERIVSATRVSAAVVWIPFVLCLFCAVATTVALSFGGPLAILCVVVCLFLMLVLGIVTLFRAIERATTEFALTDKRIVIKSGLLSTQLREMPLGKVEAINVRQDILGKLFHFGSVVVTGSGGTMRRMLHVDQPFEIYKCIQAEIARVPQGDATSSRAVQ